MINTIQKFKNEGFKVDWFWQVGDFFEGVLYDDDITIHVKIPEDVFGEKCVNYGIVQYSHDPYYEFMYEGIYEGFNSIGEYTQDEQVDHINHEDLPDLVEDYQLINIIFDLIAESAINDDPKIQIQEVPQ